MDYDPALGTYDDDYVYIYDNSTPHEEAVIMPNATCFKEASCITLLVINVLIFLLGICGNAVVIWIAGCKMKTTVNTTWYLSLAISDFIFCAFLPFNITHLVTKDWMFGLVMCKFSSFVMFLNMFSSIFLLVIISVDRCVSVMCPVWAQNHRTVRKASVAVVFAWVVSIVLSMPAMVFRDIATYMGKTICFNKYTSDEHSHKTIAASRFIGGFVIPLFIIIICYSIIMVRIRSSRKNRSSKPFKVMTALIGTFFFCWLPYHVFVLLEQNHHYHNESIKIGLIVATSLATANSFLNPVLYVFMGGDFRRKFKSSVLSKIENAIGDDCRTTSRYLSRSSSMDGRASTHI